MSLRLPPSVRAAIWRDVVEPAGARGLFAVAYEWRERTGDTTRSALLSLAATAFARRGKDPSSVMALRRWMTARPERDDPASGAEALLQLAIHGHLDDVAFAWAWLRAVETTSRPRRYHRDLARRLDELTAHLRERDVVRAQATECVAVPV